MSEEWRPIPGFPKYQVSDKGRIKGRGGKILSPTTDEKGYKKIGLYGDGIKLTTGIHRLVMQAFCPTNDPRLHCAHLDGNPANNVLENLRWTTASENNFHKALHGRNPAGTKAVNARLNEKQLAEIRAEMSKPRKYGDKIVDKLAAKYGVKRTTIYYAANQTTYKDKP